MKIPANQLSNHLKKPLLPCYLVAGDEPLLVQESLDGLRAAARRQGYDSRDVYVADTGFDWRDLAAAGGNLSLFADKRIVELRLPTGKPGKDGGAAIAAAAEQAGDDLMLIVSSPKIDARTAKAKWVTALESHGAFVPVWPVSPRELPGFIRARMIAVGLQPDGDAVRLIADRVEGNLLAAQQEIEKLRLLLGDGRVSAEHVNRAVADSSRFDVFTLVDAAVAGAAQRALRVLGGLRAEGIGEVLVVWAVVRELRVLTQVADLAASGENLAAAMNRLRVWNSRQGPMRACVARHRATDFHRMLQAARHADAAAKGQNGLDPWQLLSQIVLSLAGSARRAA